MYVHTTVTIYTGTREVGVSFESFLIQMHLIKWYAGALDITLYVQYNTQEGTCTVLYIQAIRDNQNSQSYRHQL